MTKPSIAQFPRLRRLGLRLVNVIFHSRFHAPEAIVARLAVCAATLIWSVVVLLDPDALGRMRYGAVLATLAPGWALGSFWGAIALVLVTRIWRDSQPHWIGVAGYGSIMVAWLFVAIFLWLAQRPLLGTAVATVSPIAALAVYAFLASPRPANESRC